MNLSPAVHYCLSAGGVIRGTSHFRAAGRTAQLTTNSRIAIRDGLSGVDRLRVVGCPVPYGEVSEDLGGFREVYAPGCFNGGIDSDDLFVLFNHNPNYILGRQSAGTAMFYEQSDGLYCEADPPDTSWWHDLATSMDRGDISSMSAAFFILKQRNEYRGDQRIRVIEKGKLVECSVASMAAYSATTAKLQAQGQIAVASLFAAASMEIERTV